MGVYLAPSPVMPGRFCTSLRLICPRSTGEVFCFDLGKRILFRYRRKLSIGIGDLLKVSSQLSKGGQSALRFSRLRDEKRHNYVRKIAELAVTHFITNDKCNVAGLVLAGSADFKTELSQSDLFDGRLQVKIVKIVDVSYGCFFLTQRREWV